ncbi:MAG: DUF192 domain-containing protein [Parcubacteria group bacterium]|nr:DUF192 domain-containing protein [Parcubacteria group bacterium]MBI3074882.1 DUF192 domain-containing protein [Parcubacteria group bacterium]
MKNFVSFLFPAVIFIAIIALSPLFFPKREATDALRYEQGTISLANASVSVEIPLTKTGFLKGLGGKTSLPKDGGMLFLCIPDAYQKFWMKEMRFPIDIIWIDESFTVVDITSEISPESFPETFAPSRPAAHVLEVESGFAKEHAIVPGTMVYGLGGSSCRRNS